MPDYTITDEELAIVQEMIDSLNKLNSSQRSRVLNYLTNRVGWNDGPWEAGSQSVTKAV